MSNSGNEYVYITLNQSGTRLLSGTFGLLKEEDLFVCYTDAYPIIKLEFSSKPHGIAYASIRRRGTSTWQANLPRRNLGLPHDISLSKRNTLQPALPGQSVSFDLSEVGEASRVLNEASALVYQLAGLFDAHPWLVQELGVRLVPDPEGDGAE